MSRLCSEPMKIRLLLRAKCNTVLDNLAAPEMMGISAAAGLVTGVSAGLEPSGLGGSSQKGDGFFSGGFP
jgi:hypothetical protein